VVEYLLICSTEIAMCIGSDEQSKAPQRNCQRLRPDKRISVNNSELAFVCHGQLNFMKSSVVYSPRRPVTINRCVKLAKRNRRWSS